MTRSDPALLDACRQFEAIMLRPLFDSIARSALLDEQPQRDSDGEDLESPSAGSGIMQSVFSESLALALARAGGVGFARLLATQLERA